MLSSVSSSTLREPQAHPSSFRDPSGFLFRHNGALYRQINPVYAPDYEHLISSGLYKELAERELLVSHQEVEAGPLGSSGAHKVIQPALVPFISYPYEWCFSQLKAAALLTLKIQRAALQSGMTLKDASAYNVQFSGGKPIWIDTLSFERYEEGKPWVAYRQFCQHFLAPLALIAYRDGRLSQLSRLFLDGIPLDLASSLLPWRTRWNLSLSAHLHLHAMAQKHLSKFQARSGSARLSLKGLQVLLDDLRSTISSLRWNPPASSWSDYYETSTYTPESLKEKGRIVGVFLDRIHPAPKTAWDLGANTGRFSRIPAGKGVLTLAFDADPACVELLCRQTQMNQEKGLLPLILDLSNPSSAIGWAHRERFSLAERGPADLVMALALVHHLRIGNQVPFTHLADWLRGISRWLVIEWVPKEDSQVSSLLASRKDVFTDYTREEFESAFARHFSTEGKEPVPATGRILYLMRNKGDPS